MKLSGHYTVWDGSTLASTAALTSNSLDLRFCTPVAILAKATSATGTPDFKLEYAISPDGTNFGDFTDEDDIISSTVIEWPGGSIEDWHRVSLSGVNSPYIKLKATGVASNPADSLLYLKLMFEEDV